MAKNNINNKKNYIYSEIEGLDATLKAYKVIKILVNVEVEKYKFEYLLKNGNNIDKQRAETLKKVISHAIEMAEACREIIYEMECGNVLDAIFICRHELYMEQTPLECSMEYIILEEIEEKINQGK